MVKKTVQMTEDKKGTDIIIRIVNDNLLIEELNTLIQCTREIEQNKVGRVLDIFLDASEITISTADTLTVQELTKLAQCIRDIEQNKPQRHIRIFLKTPDKTVKEMKEILNSVKPIFPIKGVLEFKRTGE